MKKILLTVLSLLVLSSPVPATQNANSPSTTAPPASAKPPGKRAPVFRATKDQIKQAQAILKDRTFYSGEQNGKLDPDTRAGIKKYQEAEALKVTGTLNKVTLVKMGIELTEKQKAM